METMLMGFWWLVPFLWLLGVLVLAWLVRTVLMGWETWQLRRMSPYVMRYGGAMYYGMHRPNVRREKSS